MRQPKKFVFRARFWSVLDIFVSCNLKKKKNNVRHRERVQGKTYRMFSVFTNYQINILIVFVERDPYNTKFVTWHKNDPL